MQTEIIWKKQFKQSSAFNITPIADPFNPNCFYVGVELKMIMESIHAYVGYRLLQVRKKPLYL